MSDEVATSAVRRARALIEQRDRAGQRVVGEAAVPSDVDTVDRVAAEWAGEPALAVDELLGVACAHAGWRRAARDAVRLRGERIDDVPAGGDVDMNRPSPRPVERPGP